jgi:hypothetical protein
MGRRSTWYNCLGVQAQGFQLRRPPQGCLVSRVTCRLDNFGHRWKPFQITMTDQPAYSIQERYYCLFENPIGDAPRTRCAHRDVFCAEYCYRKQAHAYLHNIFMLKHIYIEIFTASLPAGGIHHCLRYIILRSHFVESFLPNLVGRLCHEKASTCFPAMWILPSSGAR